MTCYVHPVPPGLLLPDLCHALTAAFAAPAQTASQAVLPPPLRPPSRPLPLLCPRPPSRPLLSPSPSPPPPPASPPPPLPRRTLASRATPLSSLWFWTLVEAAASTSIAFMGRPYTNRMTCGCGGGGWVGGGCMWVGWGCRGLERAGVHEPRRGVEGGQSRGGGGGAGQESEGQQGPSGDPLGRAGARGGGVPQAGQLGE